METTEIIIPIEDGIYLRANLNIPAGASSLVLFSHGSGSSRFSKRNQYVAEALNQAGIATLLTDLLTIQEDEMYENRFDIDLITQRLVSITNHVIKMPGLQKLKIGYFGASTGAASALKAAAQLPDIVMTVVSRGGRPDLAKNALPRVIAPTLLIVGSLDYGVIELNEQAYKELHCEKKMEVVEGATHLFEESGKLEEVAALAVKWFADHLQPTSITKDLFPFKDRNDAARKLMRFLNNYKDKNCVILAVPRGGIPIAYTIAKNFHFPVELLMTKKIGHPLQQELAIGAVNLEDSVLDEQLSATVDPTYIGSEIKRIRQLLKENYKKFMGDHQPLDLENKILLIVDDGIATGNTILSSIKMLRQKKPEKIVVAVPVAPRETAERISREVDDFICLYTPDPFIGVGLHYVNFSQVSDSEVISLLKNIHQEESI